jgi:hypothetical protein
MSLDDHWRTAFKRAGEEPNDQKREELLNWCITALGRGGHDCLTYEISAGHPRLHEIKEHFNARRVSAYLTVRPGYNTPIKHEDRAVAPDHMFVPG